MDKVKEIVDKVEPVVEKVDEVAKADLECTILSNKYNPGQPIQKPGFWLSSRPFCIRTNFIWVHKGP